MIKAILFDLDGTLINTNNLIIESFKHTFKNYLDFEVPQNDIVHFFGEPLLLSMERYDKEKATEMVRFYREYNEKMHDSLTKGFNDVEEALIKLKASGMKLAVVTSKRRNMAERGLNLININKYFDILVTPEDTKKHKPDGEPVSKCCELLNINPKEALMVGDSHNDLLCGKNAGSLTCIVKYTLLPIDELMNLEPDYAIDSLTELVDIIKERAVC